MRDWTLQEARVDFERGLLKNARIVSVMPGIWAVQLTSTIPKDGSGWLLQTRRREPRHMKTLKAAAEAITQIGFQVKQLLVE